jgi:Putative zinc- or iron-chelating domain
MLRRLPPAPLCWRPFSSPRRLARVSPSTSSLPRFVLLHRLFALLAALLVAPTAAAATLNVPSQYASISAAVTAAANGDTIVVAPGTYSNASDLSIMLTKSITIESSAGAATTIIDCSSSYFVYIEANATIRGFTIENSNSGDLSPVNFETSGTVDQCVFSNNSNFGGNGGAISTNGGTATVSSCTFDANSGSGAISSSGGSVTVTNSSFTNGNAAEGGGGGAFNVNTGTITVSDTTFDHNTGGGQAGGAIYMRNGAFTCTNCAFTNNSGSYGGVALCGAQGIDTPCAFYNTLFKGNTASISGGVLAGEGGSSGTTTLEAVDSIFVGNTAASDGAAIDGVTAGSAPVRMTLMNDSFYGNGVTSGTATGVISGGHTTTTTITNTILYGDPGPRELSTVNAPTSLSVSYTDIADPGHAGSNGNLSVSPAYVDVAASDLAITSSSPCAFVGTATGAPATDYNGNAWTGGVSMGAYAAISATSVTVAAPAAATAGTPFSFTVSVLDQNGHLDVEYSGTVHFTSSDPGATLPADATLTNGTGTLSATLVKPGESTLTATDTLTGALTGTSGPIVVSPGPAASLQVTAPAMATAGTSLSVTVTALDPVSNVATGYAGTVHFTSSDGAATLPADSTLTNGVGTFQVTLATPGGQSVTATDTVTAALTGSASVAIAGGGSDAGSDASSDAASDASSDAGEDAGREASSDAASDAGRHVSTDAGTHVGSDASTRVPPDSGQDGGDAGEVAGAGGGCSCRMSSGSGDAGFSIMAFGACVGAVARRKRRPSRGSPAGDTIVALHGDIARETRHLGLLHAARLHCQEGCSSCCIDGLTVFEVEAAHIRRHNTELLATGTPHAEGACAFLDEQGSCRIYRERPYVCQTQGLPLRWTEERDGDVTESRDICPLNDAGEPVEALHADACWSIGPVEERLAALDLADPNRTTRSRLRDLFHAK